MNEKALKEAENIYTTSMCDWIAGFTPFATFEQLRMQHQEMQEKIKNELNCHHLKGPNEFKHSFMDRLHLVKFNMITIIHLSNELYILSLLNISLHKTTFLLSLFPKMRARKTKKRLGRRGFNLNPS